MQTDLLIDNDMLTLSVIRGEPGSYRIHLKRIGDTRMDCTSIDEQPLTFPLCREVDALHDHLAREVRSSQALQARVAELEAALAGERRARDAEVMRIAEAHEAEIAEQVRHRDTWKQIAMHERELNLIRKLEADAWRKAQMRAAAKDHAREVIWSWMNTERHVPHDWTAAHPPDDLTAQTIATLLDDDGFEAYSEAFRIAWREQVEAIADEREVRHGSGKVKD